MSNELITSRWIVQHAREIDRAYRESRIYQLIREQAHREWLALAWDERGEQLDWVGDDE